jgi:TPP-dependent trihydroxycyclohexane-1,2-dione (THcHDO) dehydratase
VNKLPAQQKGASAIGTVIILVILGYAAYIGIQYVPQLIESKSVDSILRSVKDQQNTDPVDNAEDAKAAVIRLLQVNEMNDMTDSFSAKEREGGIIIEFKYDRELNLGYKKRPIHYEKTLRLN